MEDVKMKITIGNAEILFQGSVEQVCQIFFNLQKTSLGCISDMNESNGSIGDSNSILPISGSLRENIDNSTKTTKMKKRGSSTPQFLKNLDFNDKNGKNKSLKEFLNEKNPRSNVQITTAIVYYLENILNVDKITIDHVFTCYKNAGYRVPNNLVQNLTDTCSSRYGYLTRKDGKFSLSVKGSNLIEFDLPKQK